MVERMKFDVPLTTATKRETSATNGRSVRAPRNGTPARALASNLSVVP
jgi:hypothetical protein